jgi:hypothetical protein
MIDEAQNTAQTLGGSEEIFDGGKPRGSVVFPAAVRYALLLFGGLLSGAIFGVWLMEHSFRGGGSFYTELKQLQISAFTVPTLSLGAGTVALGLMYLFLVRGNRLAAGLTLAGVLCFVVGFAITVWVHFPINAQIMGWSAEAPPEEWAQLAVKWRRAHDLRTLFGVLGFGLLLAGAVLPAKGGRSVKEIARRESVEGMSKERHRTLHPG